MIAKMDASRGEITFTSNQFCVIAKMDWLGNGAQV